MMHRKSKRREGRRYDRLRDRDCDDRARQTGREMMQASTTLHNSVRRRREGRREQRKGDGRINGGQDKQ